MKAAPLAKTASVTAIAESATCVESAYKAAREEQVAQTFERPLGLDDSPDAASRESVRGPVCRGEVRRRSSPFWAAGGHRSRWSNIMSRARVSLKRGVVVSAACVVGVCGMSGGVRADGTTVIAKAGDTVYIGSQAFQITRLLTASGQLVTPAVSDTGHIAFNAILGTAGAVVHRDAAGRMNVVAKTGDTAPGGTGLRFSSIGAPVLNNSGRVAFFASVSGTGVTTASDTGFWATIPAVPGAMQGSLRMLIREGTAVAGGGQASVFSDASVVEEDDARWFSIRSTLIGTGITGANNRAFFGVDDGSQFELWARSGADAPTTGGKFNDLQRSTGPGGDTVFYSTLTGTGFVANNSHGIWVTDPSTANLVLVARSGVTAPGTTTPATFSALFNGTSRPQVNAGRAVAFAGTTMTATGVVGGGIWLWSSGASGLRSMFVSNSTVGGLTLAGPYSPYNQSSFYLADGDRVISWVLLAGAGVNSGNNLSLWVNDQAGSRMILRAGQSFPELGSGVTLSMASLGAFTRVNRRGDVALWAKFQGPGITTDNDDAMVTYVNNQLRVVARKGQVIPNSGGATIGELAVPAQIFMNNRGDLVFMVRAIGGDLPTGGQWAFVRVNAAGELGLIAIANRAFQLADGTTTRIQSFGYESSPLADDGRFVFSGTVTLPGLGTEAVFQTTIDDVVVQPPPPQCPGDFNNSGEVSQQDIFDFLAAWFAGQGDFNRSGACTVQDLFDFMTAYFAGCP